MKKLFLPVLLFFSLAGFAQSFEGTITWSMKYEINDPAKKAEMEKAQKSMNDPANQAKMKELQDKMNDPQMKAMMDANPQMKSMMEKNLKMLQGGGNPMDAMMPTKFVMKTKGTNSISTVSGGMMDGTETLYQADTKQVYTINRAAKTYSLLSTSGNMRGPRRDSAVQSKVTKTTETMKILNYTCTKNIVDITTADGTAMKQIFWTTNEVKGLDLSAIGKQRMGGAGQIHYEGISGTPLRIETQAKDVNIVLEVTDISKGSFPSTDFIIPADFKQTTGGFGY